MRLITHNLLHSAHKAGVVKGYPLKLSVSKMETIESEFSKEFLITRIPQLNWEAFLIGCDAIECKNIPKILDLKTLNENDKLLKLIHHALLEVKIIEGYLECPESGRKFPITDGIPNMLLREDEVPQLDNSDNNNNNNNNININNESKQDN